MNADIILEKRRLRKEFRKMYTELSQAYIAESDAGIFENLRNLPEFIHSSVIFSFFSIENEPDTHKIIQLALDMGKTVAVPLCHGEGIMDAGIIKSLADLLPGAYNIPAPSQYAEVLPPEKIEFAIIPALAYDQGGYRLGQGGGYYDRFLSENGFFSVGVVREKFWVSNVPFEAHDVRLRCIVTEKAIARLI